MYTYLYVATSLWLLLLTGCGESPTGRPTAAQTLGGCGEVVHTLAFAPNGALLASGNADGKLVVYALEDKSEQPRLTGCNGQIYGLAFGGSETQLFAGTFMQDKGRRGDICTYSLADHGVEPIRKRGDRQITWLGYIAQANQIITEHAIVPPQIKLWSVPELRLVSSLQIPTEDAADGPVARALSSDGELFAYVTTRGRLKIVDLKALRELANYEGCDAVAFSPRADRVAVFAREASSVATAKRRCHLVDILTGRVIRKFEPIGAAPTILAFSADGAELLCGGGRDLKEPGTLALWDTESGVLLRSFDALQGPVSVIATSRDGQDERVAVGGYGGAIKLWALSDLRRNHE